MICVVFGTSQKLAAYSYIWWLMQSESSQVSTGPRFWKLSLPYTSASCTSHQECGCYLKQHFTANYSAVFPLSFPLHLGYPTNTSLNLLHMALCNLFPRLLPSFLSHTVQRETGREPGWFHHACIFIRGLDNRIIAYALRHRVFKEATKS